MKWTRLRRGAVAAFCACLLIALCSGIGSAGADTLIFRMAWNPAGDQLAVTTAEGVTLYAYAGFNLTPTVHIPTPAAPLALAWSPSGAQLAIGDKNGLLRVWDIATGRQRWQVAAFPAPIRAIAWGDRLAVAARATGSVRLFTPTSQPDGEITLSGPVISLAFAPEGRLLAIGGAVDGAYERGFLHLWDSATRAIVQTYRADMRPASRLAWVADSPDQLAVLTRYDLFVWGVAADETRPVDMRLAEGSETAAFAWSDDGDSFGGVINDGLGSLLFVREGEREIGEFRPDGATILEIGWGGRGPQSVIALLDSAGNLRLLERQTMRILPLSVGRP